MVVVRQGVLLCALALLGGLCSAAAPVAPALTASGAAAPAVFANLPLQREESVSVGLSLMAQLAIAAALVGALAIVYRLRQRRGLGGGASPALHAGQALRLTQGTSLHVVFWEDEELLLASTGSSVTVLSQRKRAAGTPLQGHTAP